MKPVWASALLWICGSLAAQDLGPLIADGPVHWREGTIRVGDAKAEVRRVAGRAPDREVTLYLGEAYPVGQQWMYFGGADDPRLLWVELIRGHVTRVWTEPIAQRRERPAAD